MIFFGLECMIEKKILSFTSGGVYVNIFFQSYTQNEFFF